MEKYDWKQPNRLLVVQMGESTEQAKVFKAQAVLQGRCANLINALKLLANQQEDGDGLSQNSVSSVPQFPDFLRWVALNPKFYLFEFRFFPATNCVSTFLFVFRV